MRLSCEHRSIAFENTLSRCSTPANGITGRVKGRRKRCIPSRSRTIFGNIYLRYRFIVKDDSFFFFFFLIGRAPGRKFLWDSAWTRARAPTILERFDIDDKIDRWTFEELSTFFLIGYQNIDY